jgi:hypothetical protein
MKVRKIPVEVEAHRWYENGDHPMDDFDHKGIEGNVVRYFRHPYVSSNTLCKHCNQKFHSHGWIDTKEGGHIVCPGDYIITGVEGEYYPVKTSIFLKTYEKVEEPNDCRTD